MLLSQGRNREEYQSPQHYQQGREHNVRTPHGMGRRYRVGKAGFQLWVCKTQSSFLCYQLLIIVSFSTQTTRNWLLPQPVFIPHQPLESTLHFIFKFFYHFYIFIVFFHYHLSPFVYPSSLTVVHESLFLFVQSLHPPPHSCQPALRLWVCPHFPC